MHTTARWTAAGCVALLLAAALGQGVCAQGAGPQARTVPFRVFAADRTTLLFTGEYKIERAGGRIAETQRYLSAEGKVAKLDQSVYDAERRRPVSYFSANYLTGEAFRLTVEGELGAWQSEDAGGAVRSQSAESVPPGTFVWPNLIHVLAQEWEKVAAGTRIDVDLFVVSRKMKIGLELKPEDKVSVAGVSGVKVKAEPSAWLYRQMAPPAFMTVAVDPPHRILMYEGIGAIRAADGKDLETVVLFDWPAHP